MFWLVIRRRGAAVLGVRLFPRADRRIVGFFSAFDLPSAIPVLPVAVRGFITEVFWPRRRGDFYEVAMRELCSVFT